MSLRERTTLGRTGLDVCRIGIGCGNGISADDLDYALARGVNYVFTSTDLHASTYARSWETIAKVCGRSSRRRDSVVLVGASYINDADKLVAVVRDQLLSLKTDHVDIFQWGWVTPANTSGALLRDTAAFVLDGDVRRRVDELYRVRREVEDELRCRGYARFLAVSTHERALAAELAQDPLLDVLMFRYNIGHRGAVNDLFPRFGAQRVGTVAYNTAVERAMPIVLNLPALPPGKYLPTQRDLYCYALDQPEIDVVLTGPSSRDQIDVALDALGAPEQSSALRAYLEKIGDVITGRAEIAVPTASA